MSRALISKKSLFCFQDGQFTEGNCTNKKELLNSSPATLVKPVFFLTNHSLFSQTRNVFSGEYPFPAEA